MTTPICTSANGRRRWRGPGRCTTTLMYDGEVGLHRRAALEGSRAQRRPAAALRGSPVGDDRRRQVPMFANQGCWLTATPGCATCPESRPWAGPGPSADRPDAQGKRRAQVSAGHAHGRGGELGRPARRRSPASKEAGAFVEADAVARSSQQSGGHGRRWLRARLSVDAGKGPFGWNVDRKTMTPKFMFDPAKVGVKALALADVGNRRSRTR